MPGVPGFHTYLANSIPTHSWSVCDAWPPGASSSADLDAGRAQRALTIRTRSLRPTSLPSVCTELGLDGENLFLKVPSCLGTRSDS